MKWLKENWPYLIPPILITTGSCIIIYAIVRLSDHKTFCLAGSQYFKKSENPVFDKSGHQLECEEKDE